MTYNEKDVAAAIAQRKKGPPRTEGLILETTDICAGSKVPDGWIVMTDKWDPEMCGFPPVVQLNVWIIAKYSGLPEGTVMDVCASAPIPSGWGDKGTFWDPYSCGYPQIVNLNKRRIERLS